MYEVLADTDIRMYSLFGTLASVTLVIFNILQINRKKTFVSGLSDYAMDKLLRENSKKSLLIFTIVELVFTSVFQDVFCGTINTKFGNIVGTGSNYFGSLFVVPFILFVWFYFISVNPFKLMDLITPAFPLRLIFVKLACFCEGCCKGFECSWGLKYVGYDEPMFPAQLLEAGVSALLFIFFMFYRKKAKEGTLFPVYLILYSATRFFTEFTRIEEDVFWIFKTYHILCLVGILVGIIWLVIVKKYSTKIIQIYEDAPFPWVPKNVLKYQRSKKTSQKGNQNKNGVQNRTKTKKGKSNLRMWILVWSLGLMGQIGWSVEGMWFNTFVYEKIDKNPSVITPMLILSALASSVSIFLLGTLSDRTGKRRTLITIGYMLWGVCTIIFGFNQFMANRFYILAILGVIFGDMVVSFFASMSTDVGYATWTTDIMNENNQGKIGAAIAIQVVLGALLGNIIGGYIVGAENNYLRLFIVVGSVLFSFGVVSAYMFTKKDDVKPSKRGTFKEQFLSVFEFKNLLKQKELLWVNISVIVFFVGFDTYYPHLGNYLIHYLGFTADKMGWIQAIPLVLAMVVTLPVSNFINKGKFVPISVFAIITGIFGAIFMFPIVPESVDTNKIFDLRLFLGIFLLGVSYVIMLQTTKIWTKKLYPQNSKGQYEGLWAIAYALLPMTIASLISQTVVKSSGYTVMNYLTDQMEYIPNGNVFLVGVIISTMSIIPVIITNTLTGKKENIKNKKK